MTFRQSGITGICLMKTDNGNQNNRKLFLGFTVVFLFYIGQDRHRL